MSRKAKDKANKTPFDGIRTKIGGLTLADAYRMGRHDAEQEALTDEEKAKAGEYLEKYRKDLEVLKLNFIKRASKKIKGSPPCTVPTVPTVPPPGK